LALFFLLFSFWSGWSGYIILYVHSKSHINDYFVNARQIKTNIHVFFSWHGFLQVVLLLIRKKSGGSFMLNLRPFFNWKKMCPFVRLDFFYYQIRKLLQFRKLSLHLIFSYVSSKVQVFWEWHKIWKNSTQSKYVKSKWEIFFKFCGTLRIY